MPSLGQVLIDLWLRWESNSVAEDFVLLLTENLKKSVPGRVGAGTSLGDGTKHGQSTPMPSLRNRSVYETPLVNSQRSRPDPVNWQSHTDSLQTPSSLTRKYRWAQLSPSPEKPRAPTRPVPHGDGLGARSHSAAVVRHDPKVRFSVPEPQTSQDVPKKVSASANMNIDSVAIMFPPPPR